jgi:hypothetical protein
VDFIFLRSDGRRRGAAEASREDKRKSKTREALHGDPPGLFCFCCFCPRGPCPAGDGSMPPEGARLKPVPAAEKAAALAA